MKKKYVCLQMSVEEHDFVVYYCGGRIVCAAGSQLGNYISPVTREDNPALICARISNRLHRLRTAILYLLDFFTTRQAATDRPYWYVFKARLETLLGRSSSAIVRLQELRASFDRDAVLDISNQERLDQYVFDNLVDDLFLFCQDEPVTALF